MNYYKSALFSLSIDGDFHCDKCNGFDDCDDGFDDCDDGFDDCDDGFDDCDDGFDDCCDCFAKNQLSNYWRKWRSEFFPELYHSPLGYDEKNHISKFAQEQKETEFNRLKDIIGDLYGKFRKFYENDINMLRKIENNDPSLKAELHFDDPTYSMTEHNSPTCHICQQNYPVTTCEQRNRLTLPLPYKSRPLKPPYDYPLPPLQSDCNQQNNRFMLPPISSILNNNHYSASK